MIDDSTLAAARDFAANVFAGDSSGHDLHHTLRVWRAAARIAAEEGANQQVVALAALLHDVDDHKLSPATHETLGNARAFMDAHGVEPDEQEAVLTAIREVSFSQNGGTPPSTLEAACVRDADRLDAIGAIGIARCFAFGGAHGRALHSPDAADRTTSIAHFYDKLLLLKDMMTTRAGCALADARDAEMRRFLDEFLAEWDGLR